MFVQHRRDCHFTSVRRQSQAEASPPRGRKAQAWRDSRLTFVCRIRAFGAGSPRHCRFRGWVSGRLLADCGGQRRSQHAAPDGSAAIPAGVDSAASVAGQRWVEGALVRHESRGVSGQPGSYRGATLATWIATAHALSAIAMALCDLEPYEFSGHEYADWLGIGNRGTPPKIGVPNEHGMAQSQAPDQTRPLTTHNHLCPLSTPGRVAERQSD